MNSKDQYIIDSEKKANGLSKIRDLYILDKDLIIKGDYFLNTNIYCRDIIANSSLHIMTKNIFARDVKVQNLLALSVHCRSISCNHLYTSGSIITGNIQALSIIARDIKAEKISYDVLCFTLYNIDCDKIEKGTIGNPVHWSMYGKVGNKEEG